MTNWEQKRVPEAITIKAIDLLLTCFTEKDREILKIERNGQVVSLGEQFLARWWNHIPLADSPVVFRAQAMKILEANGRWIQLIERLKTDDLFAALLDPQNYKETSKKTTRFKMTGKTHGIGGTAAGSLVKTIARATGGAAALGGSWDYSKDWDISDKKRMDQLSINATKGTVIDTSRREAEEADDTPPKEDAIDKKERLDFKQVENSELPKYGVSFLPKDGMPPDEKGILLHTGSIGHQTNISGSESQGSSLSFMEALKRQNYETVKETVILAQALNNIQNLDFLDVREKLYKNFDDLFYLANKPCR